MAKGFGELAKINNIAIYKLSPYELKAFAGIFSKGIPNTLRRIRSNIFRVSPPFIVGYFIYDMVEQMHADSLRKNPADFENDV